VRAGDDAGAQCAGDHAAVRGLQRAQAGVAGQERRCVRTARVRGKTPSRGTVTAGTAARRRHPLLVWAGFVQAQTRFRAAGPVSRSALWGRSLSMESSAAGQCVLPAGTSSKERAEALKVSSTATRQTGECLLGAEFCRSLCAAAVIRATQGLRYRVIVRSRARSGHR
jgi:hypothetical protein